MSKILDRIPCSLLYIIVLAHFWLPVWTLKSALRISTVKTPPMRHLQPPPR